MKSILSIQSHVAYGYVGNRSAVFPLQRLGFDVNVINTVQFSNHTGYGHWKGDIFDAKHIDSVFEGMVDLGVTAKINALLTGYIGTAEIGQAVVKIIKTLREKNPNVMYCCDPVIGDDGRGIFVNPSAAEFFKNELIKYAAILTPNRFELAYLTDLPVDSMKNIKYACEKLSEKCNDAVILVTSVADNDYFSENEIGIFLYTPEKSYISVAPKYLFKIPPNGAGDATAALFLGYFLQKATYHQALLKTTRAIHHIFKNTYQSGQRELALINSQYAFVGEVKVEGDLVVETFS